MPGAAKGKNKQNNTRNKCITQQGASNKHMSLFASRILKNMEALTGKPIGHFLMKPINAINSYRHQSFLQYGTTL